MEEGELGTVQFLSDDRLHFDCDHGHPTPPIGQIVLPFSKILLPDSGAEDSSTTFARTRGIPRNAGTFSGPVLVFNEVAQRGGAYGQSTSQS